MPRLQVVGWVVAAVMVMAAGRALAQRDAGATARGEGAHSHNPEGFVAGLTVSVAREDTKLMRGAAVLATLKKGQDVTVIKTMDGWLGTAIELDGQTLKGWVWHKNVDSVATSSAAPASDSSASSDVRTYRRFSYQPAPQPARSGRMVGQTRERRPTPPEVRQHPGITRY